MKELLNKQEAWGEFEMMPVCAFRYCLGRQTYVVGECVEWLMRIWDELSPQSQFIIKRDLNEEIVRDDSARENNSHYRPLGADYDRAEWLKLRDHIKENSEHEET